MATAPDDFRSVPRVALDDDDREAVRQLLESIEDGTAEFWNADDIRKHREEERRTSK